ncbi:hypothetical protein [Tritonibacter mobilis]|uniref:hypothetical protein n=1 Tax=Tritonibacter mobilis TaxID=379347 RepID=UPI001C088BFC|nr:hypothetical protein [Tritonibacter mobilis]MBU3034818.1 hypothetical protein [Tritonibacter mobilis]WHQ83300.1 hypothetical protein OMR53_04130 [Tritonibacter mobilis]
MQPNADHEVRGKAIAPTRLTEWSAWLPEVDTADAALGDIAALSDGSEVILGIIGGPQVHVLTLAGPSVLSRCKAERVFRP